MLNTTTTKAAVWILNTILKHNPSSVELLKLHHDKSFLITTTGLSIAATIDDNGLFEQLPIYNKNEHNYTVEINIPINIITYAINQNKLDTFKKISFIGDKYFGRTLLEILSNLHINDIYKTKNPVILLIINRIHYLLNMLQSQFILMTNNISHSFAEYIQYETRDIANPYEIENFCTQVDELKARTELLMKRIALLKTK
jgi:ubiquinone biosynthesis protein UbiJ